MSNRKSDAASVEQYCAENEDFVLCRDDGHSWPRRTPPYLNHDGGGDNAIFSKRLECERCGLVRYKRVQRIGNGYMRIEPTYEYPDGYLTQHLGLTKENIWRYQIEGSADTQTRKRGKRKNSGGRQTRRLRSVS